MPGPTVVQNAHGATSGGASSVSASFGSLPSVGNVVFVFPSSMYNFNLGSISSVSDNQTGNTYNADFTSTTPLAMVLAQYSALVNGSSGTFTVTVGLPQSDSSATVDIVEVSGLTSSSWFDVGGFTSSGFSGAWATGNLSATTAQASEIEFAFAGQRDNGTWQPSIDSFTPAYTLINQNAVTTGGGSSSTATVGLWYRILTATTNVGATGTFTSTTDWYALATANKAASGGAAAFIGRGLVLRQAVKRASFY